MRLLRKEKLKKGRKIASRPQVLIGSCISTFLFIGFRPLVFCLRSSLCCRPFTHRRIVTIADERSGYAVLVCNNERRGKLCINDQRGKQLNVRRKFREVCSTDRSSMLIPTRILIIRSAQNFLQLQQKYAYNQLKLFILEKKFKTCEKIK